MEDSMKRLSLKLVMVLMLVISIVALLVPTVMASPMAQAPLEIPNLIDFLTLLTSTVGVGMVVSFVLANLERYQNVSTQAKFWIVFAICMILPIAATAILNLVPAATLTSLEPYWKAIAGGFAVFIGSQVFYAVVVKKTPAKPAA
jgi:hypothetical protein